MVKGLRQLTGVITVRSGRCVPPALGWLLSMTSPSFKLSPSSSICKQNLSSGFTFMNLFNYYKLISRGEPKLCDKQDSNIPDISLFLALIQDAMAHGDH